MSNLIFIKDNDNNLGVGTNIINCGNVTYGKNLDYANDSNILAFSNNNNEGYLKIKARGDNGIISNLHIESEGSGNSTGYIHLKAWTGYSGVVNAPEGGGGEVNIETMAGTVGSNGGRAEGKVNIITETCCIQGAGLTPNAKVGINTTSPLASLHVKIGHQNAVTTGNTNMTRFRFYSDTATLAQTIQHGTINDQTYMGAIFEGHVWLPNNHALYVSSDSRIKNNIIDVPDNLALQQLRSIPCRYYEYIDKFIHGTNQTIGFIAQEVKSVLPMAVIEQKEIIPNIHKVINCTWTSVDDKFIMNSSDLLNVSDVKYKFYVSNESDSSDEKEIILTGNSDNTFTFDTQYTNVFCYGSEVEDFHTLDKTKLFTLNFSATQEIDRIQQTHITEIASLKAENTELKTKLNELTNKIKNATTFEDLKNSL